MKEAGGGGGDCGLGRAEFSGLGRPEFSGLGKAGDHLFITTRWPWRGRPGPQEEGGAAGGVGGGGGGQGQDRGQGWGGPRAGSGVQRGPWRGPEPGQRLGVAEGKRFKYLLPRFVNKYFCISCRADVNFLAARPQYSECHLPGVNKKPSKAFAGRSGS